MPLDRNRIVQILLLVAFVGVGVWLWQQRASESEPARPGLKYGEWIAEFDLLNDLGHARKLNFPRGEKGTVLFFWHVQCPAVQALHPRFEALKAKYSKRGFVFAVIDSEPLDTLDDIKARRDEWKVTYPVLRDDARKTATKLGVDRAATFLVFDHEARLVYRGAFDDGLKPPKVGYVVKTLSAILADTPPRIAETTSAGCEYTDPNAPPPPVDKPGEGATDTGESE